MTPVSVLHFMALAMLLTIAVVTDLRERRIPNKLTVPALIVGLVLGGLLEGGFPGTALTGAAAALLATLPICAMGALGAGDAKLLTAVGAFVGPGGLLSVMVYGAIAGGIVALVSVIRRGAMLDFLRSFGNLLLFGMTFGAKGRLINLNSPGAHTVPYGIAIAAGAVLTWFVPFSLGSWL